MFSFLHFVRRTTIGWQVWIGYGSGCAATWADGTTVSYTNWDSNSNCNNGAATIRRALLSPNAKWRAAASATNNFGRACKIQGVY